MTTAIPRHPAFRLFGVAGILWLGVVFYSYGVFHKFHSSRTDYGLHPKEIHPAGEFLRSAKSLKQQMDTAAKAVGSAVQKKITEMAANLTGESVCRESVAPNYVKDCTSEVEKLSVMNPTVANHFLRMLKNHKANNKGILLQGADVEHPCMKISTDAHRKDCYKTVVATNDLKVAQKISLLIRDIEHMEPVAVTLHDAKIACALAKEKANCIHDVMGTGDIETAEIYDKLPAPKKNAKTGKLELAAHHHHMTKADAEQACKMVHKEDRAYCQEHIMKMDDEETAEHYVHLLQDAEHHLGKDAHETISVADSRHLCAQLKNKEFGSRCLQDIWVVPNKHVGEHFIELYDLTGAVPEKQAEKLCNHLNKDHHNHETCIETIVKMPDGPAAASHYSDLLKHHREEMGSESTESKPLIKAKDATTVCQDVKPKDQQEDCRKDVLTMNNLVAAQKYAHMLVQIKKK